MARAKKGPDTEMYDDFPEIEGVTYMPGPGVDAPATAASDDAGDDDGSDAGSDDAGDDGGSDEGDGDDEDQ